MQNVVRIFFKGETKSFEKQIEQVETELENMTEEYKAVKKSGTLNDQDLQKFETDIEKTTNKLADLKRKQLELSQTKVFETMNKGLKQAVKNVLKWGLAFIGLRSAISLVRSSMNTIMGYDKQLATDMEYIRTAIATALEPVVRRLVDLLKQMLYYVGYIVKIWTGKNIFKDANKNLQKANASAKELAKTTAGFDEMNVLNDNKSSGGAGTPSFDLSVENQPVPDWVDWIARNGEMLSNVLLGIATALIAVKLGFTGVDIFGVAMVLSGIVISIKSLLDYIKSPNWQKFGNIIQGIGITLLGLGVIFTSLPLAVAGAIALILGTLASFWDTINSAIENFVSNVFKVGDNIMNFIQEHLGVFGSVFNVVIGTVVGVVTSCVEIIRHLLDGLFSGVRNILDGIIYIVKGDFANGIVNIIRGLLNLLIGMVNVLIDGLNAILSPIRALVVAIGKVTGQNWTMDNIKVPNIPKLAKGGIANVPNKGVFTGSAVFGEAGPEAYIPLNDETLDRLGSAFARHTTINATMINKMNGRIIGRELQKLSAEDNFAYNR